MTTTEAPPVHELAVSVEDLTVTVEGTENSILESMSCTVARGEVLAVVGESGSGKSTLGLTLLGHTRPGLKVTGGRVQVGATTVTDMTPTEAQRIRGAVVAYVPQDASVSLNPAKRLGSLFDELLRVHHRSMPKAEREERAARALRDVELPDSAEFRTRFIHQLSGGQQQRLGIALALVTEPAVIVLDEPTTGLDAITQRSILAAVAHACRQRNAAAVFITHDLEIVKSIADRVLVLYAGRLAEFGPTADLIAAPAHPYTRGLLQSAPSIDQAIELRGIPGSAPVASDRSPACAFAPRCPMAELICETKRPAVTLLRAGHGLECYFPQRRPLEILGVQPVQKGASGTGGLAAEGLEISYGRTRVVHGVDIAVERGTCVGLVGASGSGKTTVSRALVGLVEPSAGSITLDGREIASSVDKRDDQSRRAIQYVFQNPYSSLNPRRTILETLEQPARAFGLPFSRAIAIDWLDRVKLSARALDRRPDALSGGERQRVAIARALACNPEFLICDEITAPLDVSVQAAIVELIRSILVDSGLGILFVTHDLGVMRSLADRIAIFQDGRCVEFGPTDAVFDTPSSEYGRTLLAAARDVTSAGAHGSAEL